MGGKWDVIHCPECEDETAVVAHEWVRQYSGIKRLSDGGGGRLEIGWDGAEIVEARPVNKKKPYSCVSCLTEFSEAEVLACLLNP